MRVIGCAARANVDPILVESGQFILETNLLWFDKAQSGIADFQTLLSRSQLHILPAIDHRTVEQTSGNLYGWRQRIKSDLVGVNYCSTPLRGKPQMTIVSLDSRRLRAAVAFDIAESIVSAVGHRDDEL